ncbi:MAG: NUDIX domain-containing protein [Bacteroidota bacterium]
MYKVYINDKPLYLTSQIPITTGTELSGENILKSEYKSEKEIHTALDMLAFTNTPGAVIFSENEKQLWEKFCEQFKVIEAAGGLVVNEKKELLMIYRFEKWDLPKGKLEKNEKPDEAALREVCEETGVCDCEIIKELTPTYHTYTHYKKNILKKTFWFEMKCKSFSGFKLQDEEGIKDAKWMDKEKLNGALKNTYPSISGLITEILL